jgi:tetratricopeptide (TPR) repeat protein
MMKPKCDKSQSAPMNPTAVIVPILLGVIAYSNSFSGVFVFDDLTSITQNPLFQGGGWEWLWTTPEHVTVSGRPAAQWSFALNYFLHGESLWGYHFINLLIHLGSAVLIYCITNTALCNFSDKSRVWRWMPMVLSSLWVAHPLTTSAVTYLVQRTESQAVFFYLLALLASQRWLTSTFSKRWGIIAIAAGGMGALTKELLVTLPVAVLLYDWVILRSPWNRIWRRHWPLYAGLGSVWVIVALLFFTGTQLDVTTVTEISRWDYLRTQAEVIAHYLTLVVWPQTLILDYYNWPVPEYSMVWWLQFLGLGLTCIYGLLGTLRRRVSGMVVLLFFIWLAPYSSFVPIIDPAFEHRMYFPLLAVLAALTASICVILEKVAERRPRLAFTLRYGLFFLFALMVSGLVLRTQARNSDYHTEVGLWQATYDARPTNARALQNMAEAHFKESNPQRGFLLYEKALRRGLRQPVQSGGHYNLANHYFDYRRFAEAERHYSRALEIKPDYGKAYANRAVLYMQRGRFAQAAEDFRKAIALLPEDPILQVQMAIVQVQMGNYRAAQDHIEEARRRNLEPPTKLIEQVRGGLSPISD